MSPERKYGVPLKHFNILGASEIRQSRLMIALLFVAVSLVAVIVYQQISNQKMQEVNQQLAAERVMYGFPNAEGVFVSSKQIPRHHIEGFVTWFVSNYYNFTPRSAEANANEALRLMSPALRVKQEALLKTVAAQSINQEITQVFANETPYSIELSPGQGYVVTFRGQRVRATLARVFSQANYEVKLLIKPVKPSAHFEWAVVVDNLSAQEI